MVAVIPKISEAKPKPHKMMPVTSAFLSGNIFHPLYNGIPYYNFKR